MAASTKAPSPKAFRTAFLALEPRLTETRRRILAVHYRALGRQLTMTQIAEAVGWRSYSSANSHYGRLAKLVGEQVGYRHPSCHLFTLCTFVRPQEKGDHWLIIMRERGRRRLASPSVGLTREKANERNRSSRQRQTRQAGWPHP